MATAGTHNYRIFMERGLPLVQSITRRWLRGSLLITICILAAALGLFLYYSHQNLYGGVQRAMQARFSTVEGRLQATGTAGSSQATSESRCIVADQGWLWKLMDFKTHNPETATAFALMREHMHQWLAENT